MEHFDEKELSKDLKRHAKAVGIPSGAAEIFVEKTIINVKKQFKTKNIITSKDLERMVTKELKQYSSDLAYVYKNRDKII